jgi:predicted nuclease with TOPRIM domain
MTPALAKIQECLREARTEAATLRIEKAKLEERVKELRKELDQCLVNARGIAKAHAEQVARLKGEIAQLEKKLHDVGALGFAP